MDAIDNRQEIEKQTSELGTNFARCGIENFKLRIIDCVQCTGGEGHSARGGVDGSFGNILGSRQH